MQIAVERSRDFGRQLVRAVGHTGQELDPRGSAPLDQTRDHLVHGAAQCGLVAGIDISVTADRHAQRGEGRRHRAHGVQHYGPSGAFAGPDTGPRLRDRAPKARTVGRASADRTPVLAERSGPAPLLCRSDPALRIDQRTSFSGLSDPEKRPEGRAEWCRIRGLLP